MTAAEPKAKKRKFWEVDPSMFKPGPKDSWRRRYFVEPARTLAKFTLLGLFFAYPLFLIVVGLVFGPIFFWGSFLGSVGLIGFLLTRFGYARNFAAWNPDFRRQIVGLTAGFLLTLGFWYALTTYLTHLDLPLWSIALGGGLIIIIVAFIVRRAWE